MCFANQSSTFRAASLRDKSFNWSEIGAPNEVLDWIQYGVYIPFVNEPYSFHLPNRAFTGTQGKFIKDELQDLLQSGAIKEVYTPPTCVSPISCVPKKGGKFRLIVDLRLINQLCETPKFRNEDIGTVIDIVQPHDLLITLDLKNGFHHIPIAVKHQQFLGFHFQGRYFVWQVLPFGLSSSPYFFCKTVRPVISFLRRQGVRITSYVDDFCLCAQQQLIHDHKRLLIGTLEWLGWVINEEKSSLQPENSKLYIGYKITTGEKPMLHVPNERIYKLRKDLKRILSKCHVTARMLARIAGQCVSMAKAVPPAKLMLRNTYRLLASKTSWSDVLTLDEHTHSDLQWWVQALSSWNGAPIQKGPIDMQMETDASTSGWGACITGTNQFAAGFWNERLRLMPSNYREMMAVLMALKSFNFPRGIKLQVLTDNVTTACYINQLGGPSPNLAQLANALWMEAHDQRLTLSARHLQGKLNVTADTLSRLADHYEWQLNTNLFRYLNQIWGPHTIDRFATMSNTQLPLYNSRYADPYTAGVDALPQQNWHTHNNFVNPPFRLIGKILHVIEAQGAHATLIAPYWPAQPWFRKLQMLSIAPPVTLPKSRLTRGDVMMPEALKNKKWRIFAWRVCGMNKHKNYNGQTVHHNN
jgi:hypothetical protein